jgi:hypothetical protein
LEEGAKKVRGEETEKRGSGEAEGERKQAEAVIFSPNATPRVFRSKI